jgi:D-alanyl-D-alanine carboxypeptidase
VGTIVKAWTVGAVLTVLAVVMGFGMFVTWDVTRTTSATSAVGGPVTYRPDDAVQVTTTSSTAPVTPVTTAPPTLQSPQLPPCEFGDEPVVRDPLADWATVVVDTTHRLDEGFVPPDLVPVSEAGFRNTEDRVRAGMIPDLAAMRAAAEANGTPFLVVSAFRDFAYQRGLYESRVASEGPEATDALTARPGHSEHQLGTTIDVLNPEETELTTAFGDTPAGQWVAEHAHEFGFVLSYPDGGRDTTCYDYEPWHVRFVGRETAAAIEASGMPPRQWLLTQLQAAG